MINNDRAFTEITNDEDCICLHYVFITEDNSRICMSKLLDHFDDEYEMVDYVNEYMARNPECIELVDWYTCRFIDARA